MSYTKQQSQAEFGRWSESYDQSILQRLIFAPSHGCILEQIGDERPIRVLDIGCGTGQFLERLDDCNLGGEIWGIDFSAEMIEKGIDRLRGRASGIQMVCGDSESLPIATDTFDVVTCSNSFHHYPDQVKAVAEMHRVLRPGGRLMIVDGYRDRIWGRFVYDVCVVAVEGAVHHASARTFRELFLNAGFADVRQQARLGLAPFLLTTGTAQKTAAVDGQTHPSVIAA